MAWTKPSASFATLENALEALSEGPYLGIVMDVEGEIRQLSRRLGYDGPFGGEP